MSLSGCSLNFCSSRFSVIVPTAHASKLSSMPSKHHYLDWKQKVNLVRNRRPSKVIAYYGLRSPPYKLDALEPYMSQRTLETHWREHYGSDVDALNRQLAKNDVLYGRTLEELIKVTYNNGNPLPEFNNAAQVWNHDFFWESMQPDGGNSPILGLHQQIEKDFGSFTNFREKFIDAALTLFGSGWVWLVLKREEKRLAIVQTSNAVNPLVWNDIPLLNLDMWEHAYYLDYKPPCILECGNGSHGSCTSFCEFRRAQNSCCVRIFLLSLNLLTACIFYKDNSARGFCNFQYALEC